MCDHATLLDLPDDWQLSEIRVTSTLKIVSVSSVQLQCCCPMCGHPSQSIHSHYTRLLADLPCGDQPLRIKLQSRKFVCRNTACPRKIFTERFPTFLKPWARRTERLAQALERIALATSGEQGARLATLLQMPASPTTLLRRIMDLPPPTSGAIEQVGIDDWALRRGRAYGSVLVNLETHAVIDLLPDRTATTAAAWFRRHPDLTIISGDRGGDYATAARAGAPQATQVADRFHLVKNVVRQSQM
jgi:transposase